MTDAFSLLQLPRRPWIDPREVRTAFQRLAATAHPDRSGSTADFTALTRAHETLREPASLLRHFLALEHPRRTAAADLPADLMEWFPRVAAQLQALKRPAPNAGEGEALLAELTALRDAALSRVREVDASDFDELARLLSRLGFLDKWTAQLGEALLALQL